LISYEQTEEVATKWLNGLPRKTFEEGSKAFNELMNTPTGKSKAYLLKEHPEAFPGKRVTNITVILRSDKKIDIEYEFGLQLEQ
jgi:hypothetical protein